ncbi:MAG: hypothetical protein IPN38_18305 [Flavobacteriales bacterium]|nr:hypothetical protein [Flavobacteriales bacterium]
MIIEFNQNGDEQWGTLFGGNDIEDPGYHGLDIDPVTGDIYIVGYTRSSNLPLLYTTDWHDATPPSGNANGFIAEFSSTRNRKWITYVSNSGTGGLDAVRVGQDRSVFIAGYAHAGFQTQPMGGLYESNAPLGDQDGVIMRFDTDHNYLWGTYFGGDTPGTIDKVYSIALRGTERLYTCGKTNSPNGPNDFFPLSDELIPGSWFNPNFQPGTDGFVAAFCIAPTAVGLPNFEATGGSSLLAWVDDGGWWSVMGGTPGLQPLFICDAAGRVVQHAQMRVPSDTPLRFNTASLSPGAYVLRIGERSAKVLVVQHLPIMATCSSIRGVLLLACGLWISSCMAQPYWAATGLPERCNPMRQVYAPDSVGNELYIVGRIILDTSAFWYPLNPVMRYSGGAWDTLSYVQWGFIESIVVYHDTLIIGGNFNFIEDGSPCEGILYWANGAWHPFGNLEHQVRKLRVLDDTLYATAASITRMDCPPWESRDVSAANGCPLEPFRNLMC